jgi:long-chain-fatty-acid---luciferin-component ligase
VGVTVTAGEARLAAVEPLDALLSGDGLYALGPDAADELRLAHLRAAVDHHRAANPHYDRLCHRRGFGAHQLRTVADLAAVPLLPTSAFKRAGSPVASATASPVVATTSSGTQGTVSVVPRDDETLMRFFASISAGARELLGLEHLDARLFNLGPPVELVDHLWIAYVMAGAAVFCESDYYTDGSVFAVDELVADLLAADGERVALIGPPPLLVELAAALGDRRPALRPDSLVVAIGGWKRRSGSMIERDRFDELLATALGLDPGQVRDAFNMVELNSVVFECAAKAKHCPPWLDARARDPRTLDPLPSGEPGILAFLDPTPTSYPGFVLSDDFGSVEHGARCGCGRVGDLLRIERRINRIESRGCALKLDVAGTP